MDAPHRATSHEPTAADETHRPADPEAAAADASRPHDDHAADGGHDDPRHDVTRDAQGDPTLLAHDHDLVAPASPGTWIWPAATSYYAGHHDITPPTELLHHIRTNNYTAPAVDPDTLTAATQATAHHLRG